MNKIILILSLSLAASCTNINQGSFTLSGQIEDAIEAEAVYLSYPVQKDGVWYEKRDTAVISNGNFRFAGRIEGTTPAYLSFDNMDGEYLYIEPAKLRLRMDRKRPYAFTLSGSSIDKEFAEFQRALAESQQMRYESHRHVQDLNAQWAEADEKDKDSLWSVFYQAVQPCKKDLFREDSLRFNFASEHLNYSITPHLLYLASRSQVADDLLLKQLYDRLPETTKNSIMGQLAGIRIGFHAQEWGYNVGDNACDFTRTDASGNTVRLSDYRGEKYVLLDFWASWCGPCMKEIPKVKRLQAQYGSKRLQIIGISCDEDRSKWLRAIEKNSLTDYPQVLSVELDANEGELLFEDQINMADIYDVTSIPAFILIAPDGKISARWQRIGQEQLASIDQVLR